MYVKIRTTTLPDRKVELDDIKARYISNARVTAVLIGFHGDFNHGEQKSF